MMDKDIIVGLDIGTTKIGVVVAEKGQFGEKGPADQHLPASGREIR